MKTLRLSLLFLVAFIFSSGTIYGQCCAAGNPISDDGSAAGVGKNMLETSLFSTYSYSDLYYKGNEKTDYKYIDYSYFLFSSVNLAYGISNRLKITAEIGYFFAKAQYFVFDQNRNATGLGDLVLGAQYLIYRNNQHSFNIFPRVRVTLPIGKFDKVDGAVLLPIDIQPSSGSFKYHIGFVMSKLFMGGNLALFFDNSVEFSQRIQTSRTNYKYGNLYNNSLHAGYKLHPKLTASLQIRSQIREKASDKNKELINATGGHVMFSALQLRYLIAPKWNVMLKYEFPFYKNMNGTQLTNNYVVSLRLSKNFDFSHLFKK